MRGPWGRICQVEEIGIWVLNPLNEVFKNEVLMPPMLKNGFNWLGKA